MIPTDAASPPEDGSVPVPFVPPLAQLGPVILVVDPQPDERSPFVRHLTEQGYFPLHVASIDEADIALRTASVDLIVLDLPSGSIGLRSYRLLRELTDLPVIIASGQQDELDRVIALELGADDYVTKPYGARELVARIGAVLRRSSRRCTCGTVASARDFTIDPDAYGVHVGGRFVALTPREFRLLDALARNPGQILTRAQLLDLIALDAEIVDRTLDKHVANLRRKVELDPARPARIVTVFGIGYKYVG